MPFTQIILHSLTAPSVAQKSLHDSVAAADNHILSAPNERQLHIEFSVKKKTGIIRIVRVH
ncbi:hypothetical protein [Symbiopectobacterium purcellii]|uniref:hypothetical protein n=1 Tax=Symbiopectobacterium purcellii TaxID=2871826 RepID=UPI003F853917